MSIQINQHVLLTVSTELTPVLFYPILYSFILKCFLGSKQTEVHCRICIFFSVLKIATFFLWRHLNLYFQLSIPRVLNCYFLDEESPASCWKAAQPFIKNLKFHWDEEKRQLMTVLMSQKFSRWIGVPRPSHVSRVLIYAHQQAVDAIQTKLFCQVRDLHEWWEMWILSDKKWS